MNQNKRYHNYFRKQVMLPCAVIILLFTGALGSSNVKNYNIHDRFNQLQSLKTSSSQPLSSLNFYKTRPKGLITQEPIYKYSELSRLILLYTSGKSTIIFPVQTNIPSYSSGNTPRIRPPPMHYTEI